MSADLDATVDQARAALEQGDFEGAQRLLEAAATGGANMEDPRLLHLGALLAWAGGDIDEAVSSFERALAAKPVEPRLYVDAGELYADMMNFDDAEDVLRTALEREDLELNKEDRAEVLLLLAQTRLAHLDADPEEALELLDQIDPSLHTDPAWVSVRAAALAGLGRAEEGEGLLAGAVERETDPEAGAELLYQLGLAQRATGKVDAAVESWLALRRRDLAQLEVDADAELEADERDDLQRQLEDVLESLPDPVLKLVATAPIRVERWVSEAMIRGGYDPRSAVIFEGRPSTDDAAAELQGIVLFRDMIVAEIDSDEEIADAIVESLVNELDRFFDIEGLVPGV
ncbi:tetratricopeptide repeat protein [Plesiocystis pacifica]|uniref:tetratricopeptide repeat protein n=1 Tax=Plesiocystis pacifica TaxID=191768 RepID=UPI000A3125BB|nr:tetratricopeptide repeat protein [Plesiocystis pacifica]